MRKAKKLEVGKVIQFPHQRFEQGRRGWNGWIFRVGIIEKLFVLPNGKKAATVRFGTGIADKYQLLPNKEDTKNIYQEYLFEYNVEAAQNQYRKFRELEKAGEKVCWSRDTALLVNHGIITE